jgi:hypothetical protein
MAKDKDSLKLSKATVKKINKVATGPLFNPVAGKDSQKPATEVSTVARLGTIQDVQARMQAALDTE